MPEWNATDTKGTTLRIEGESPPSDEDLQKLFDDHYAEQRTFLGQGFETLAKGVPRGLLGGALSSAEGLAELADAATNRAGFEDLIDTGDDNWLVNKAREGQKALRENSFLAAAPAYQDTWMTHFGEGLGSMAMFLTPGVALKALGYVGKAGQYGSAGVLAASQYAGEQAQRIENQRLQGIDVTEEQEDLAVFLGAGAGLTELAPVASILSRITRFAPRQFKNKFLEAISNAMKSGSVEAVQEVGGAFLQDAIERNIYNENLPKGQSYWDELTIGGAVGFTADLLLNAAIRDRGGLNSRANREREADLREKLDRQFKIREAQTSEAAAARQERLRVESATNEELIRQAQALELLPVPEGEARFPAMKQYARQIADHFGNKFPVNTSFGVEQAPGGMFVVLDSNGNQYGRTLDNSEDATMLAGALNEELINLVVRNAVDDVIDSSPESGTYDPQVRQTLERYGWDLIHPDANTVSASALNLAAETTFVRGYQEELSADEMMRRFPDATFRGGLTAVQAVNKERLAKGLPEMDTFTLQEARDILGENFGNLAEAISPSDAETYVAGLSARGKPVVRSSAGEVISQRKAADPDVRDKDGNISFKKRPFKSIEEAQAEADKLNERRRIGEPIPQEIFDNRDKRWPDGLKELQRLLDAKNISSSIESPEMSRIADVVTGNPNIEDMTAGEMRMLYQRIRSLPRFDVKTQLPNFKPKIYSRQQFQSALRGVQNTGNTDLEFIKQSAGILAEDPRADQKAQSILDDLQAQRTVVDNEVESFEDEQVFPAEEAQEEILRLPPPETELTELRKRVKQILENRYGLTDVGISVDNLLKNVIQDAEGKWYIGAVLAQREGPNGAIISEIVPAQPIDSDTEGFYDPSMNHIFLALDRIQKTDQDGNIIPQTVDEMEASLADILSHEVIHPLRRMDLWTQKEWSSLENLARERISESGVSFLNQAENLYSDRSPSAQMEEAIAEMIRESRRDPSLITGKPRALVKRIFEFFKRFLSAMRGTGFQNFGDIIARLESGKIASRRRGEIRTLKEIESTEGALERGILPSPRESGRVEDFLGVSEARRIVKPRRPALGELLLPIGEVEEGLIKLFDETANPTSEQLGKIPGAPRKRRRQVIDRKTKEPRKNAKGKFITTPNSLDVDVKPTSWADLIKMAEKGLRDTKNLGWYREFSEGLRSIVGDANIEEAAIVFGITSQQNAVEMNLADTLHIMKIARDINPEQDVEAFKKAVKTTKRPGGQALKITGNQIDRIARMYVEGYAGGGLKTTTYMQNIIDKASNTFNPFSVQDVHMARVFGWLQKAKDPKTGNRVDAAKIPGDNSYRYAQFLTSKLAEEFDVRPDQMQAALWFHGKKYLAPKPKKGKKNLGPGTWESASKYSVSEIQAIQKQVSDGIFNQEQPLTIALAKGIRPESTITTPTKPYSNVVTPELLEAARELAPRVVVSTTPGYDRGFGIKATLEQQKKLRDRGREAITDKDGKIPFITELGIPHEVVTSFGTYAGVEPNILIRLLGGTLAQSNFVANVLGDALLQDSAINEQMAYDGKQHGVGVLKNDQTPFTEAEILVIAQSINPDKNPDGNNFTQIAPNTLTFLDPRQFNDEISYDDAMAVEFMQSIANAMPSGLQLDIGTYSQNGDFNSHERYRQNIKESWSESISTGSPDLLARINDTLYKPYWAVYTEFAREAGETGATPQVGPPTTVVELSEEIKRSRKGFSEDYLQTKTSRSQGEIDAVVQENVQRTEASRGATTPRVNYHADPEAQFIAESSENQDKALEVPESMKQKFSRKRNDAVKDAPVETQKIIHRMIGDVQDGMPGQGVINDLDPDQTEKSFHSRWQRFRRQALNKYAPIEERSYRDEFKQREADTSAYAALMMADRGIQFMASAFKYGVPTYKNGVTQVVDFYAYGHRRNKRRDRGLLGLFAPLYDNSYGKNLEGLAKAYSIARRVIDIRKSDPEAKTPIPVGEEQKTLDMLTKQIQEYIDPVTGKPIIEEWYDGYQQYNDHVIEFMRDTGVIDEESARRWKNMASYVPFYKEAQGEKLPAHMPSVFKGLTGTTDFKQVGKSESEIDLPLIEAITRNVAAAIDMGMKNVAQQRIIRDEVELGMARELVKGEAVGNEATVTFKVDGKKKTYIVYDNLVHEAMLSMGDSSLSAWVNTIFGAPSGLLREMVTREPAFIVANMIRDTMSAWVTTGGSFVPVIDTLKNFFREVETLEKLGIAGGYDFARDPKNITQYFAKQARKRGFDTGQLGLGGKITESAAMKPFKLLWDVTGSLTTRSDASTRRAVFDDVLARTGNLAEAQFQSLEVINFGRRGSHPVTKFLGVAIPFLNARGQGLDVLHRAGTGRYTTRNDLNKHRGRIALSFLVRGAILAGSTMMYYTLVSDDDEYKTQDEHVKDNNWIVLTKWTGLPVPIKIPIPFEVGILFKVIVERLMALFQGDTTKKDVAESFGRAVTSTFEVSPLGIQALGPLIEAWVNYNSYTGEAIVPTYMDKGVEEGFQDYYGTLELAKAIGKQFDISPLRVQHAMTGYGGTIGSYLLAMANPILRDEDQILPTRRLEDYPILRRFLTSKQGGGLQSQFYELMDDVNRIVPTLNRLSRQGRMEEYEAYMNVREVQDLLAIKDTLGNIGEKLSDLRRSRDAILYSKNIPPDRKRELLDGIEVEMNRWVEIVPKLKAKLDQRIIPVIQSSVREQAGAAR